LIVVYEEKHPFLSLVSIFLVLEATPKSHNR
jgi:hypothetical protein